LADLKREQEEDNKMKEQQLTNEKLYYKLADYFCTIGIDDYYTREEETNMIRPSLAVSS
jgi:uncharacterized membrane-anchored protein